MGVIEFLPQCCDADGYAGLGYQCSVDIAKCYSSLRPVGGAYLFSLPHRLGLPLVVLVYINILLLIVSSVLSVVSMSRLVSVKLAPSRLVILLLLSLFIHWFVMRPVLFSTLLDAPAGLFFLIGIWLLINSQEKMPFLQIAVGALSLGIATLLRAFYLYPLFAALLISLIFFMFGSNKNKRALLIFIALIPVSFQYAMTYSRTGEVGFIEMQESQKWSKFHLESSAMGYDTIVGGSRDAPAPLEEILVKRGHLPMSYHKEEYSSVSIDEGVRISPNYWESGCGVNESGLIGALKGYNIDGVVCIVASRVYFYLGSYASKTYMVKADSRVFSKTLLIINILAMVGAILCLYQCMPKLKPIAYVGVSLSIFSFLQALLIIPEQRFILVFYVVIWVLCVSFLMKYFSSSKQSSIQTTG